MKIKIVILVVLTIACTICCGIAFAHPVTCHCSSGIPTDPGWAWVTYPTCSIEGEKVGRCSICNYHVSQFIAPVPHEYLSATCTQPEVCRFGCGTTRGSALGHDFPPVTCVTPRFCRRSGCSAIDNTKGNHTFDHPNCLQYRTCMVCNYETNIPGDHSYSNATCFTPKTCIYCGEPTGLPLGHKYTSATCISLATCIRCGTTTGSYAPHQYINGSCILCGRPEAIQDQNPEGEVGE